MRDREQWVRVLGEDMFSTGTYRDEPILRTAASMRNYMPPQYRDMRRLALQNGRRSKTAEEIFYAQAKFMEDFEDDYDYGGEFFRYYPTYQSMSDIQLRGYFSWRTQVRRGNLCKTSLSFVFVYLYELINGIGSPDAVSGYERLYAFCDAYGAIDPRIVRYAQTWMRDYVVYHGLDHALLAAFYPLQTLHAKAALRCPDEQPDDALFAALCACSSYSLEHSRFYRTCAEPMQAVVCAAYRAWADYYGKNRKTSLFEALVGRPFTTSYTMFSTAIFCPQAPHPDADVEIDTDTIFRCRDGRWTYTRMWSSAEGEKQIGMLMRAVDAAMRVQYAYAYPLKIANAPAYLQKIIAKCIDEQQANAARQAVREVEIDLSKLQGIRDAADVTRDKLIVDVEEIDGTDEKTAQQPEPVAQTGAVDPFGFDETERAVLRALLVGGDAQAVLQGTGLPLSVVTDSINEKCFDAFGDTVLLFDGDVPSLTEDYVEELKGTLL